MNKYQTIMRASKLIFCGAIGNIQCMQPVQQGLPQFAPVPMAHSRKMFKHAVYGTLDDIGYGWHGVWELDQSSIRILCLTCGAVLLSRAVNILIKEKEFKSKCFDPADLPNWSVLASNSFLDPADLSNWSVLASSPFTTKSYLQESLFMSTFMLLSYFAVVMMQQGKRNVLHWLEA